MPKPFFITTAIDYTNGAPHIGHAYEKVLADVLARYHRLKGDEVFYLTGVDQHGQKVQQSAEKAGIEPQEYVDGVTKKFTALWEKLDVKYDAWAATTDPLHKECVRANLQKLWDDKDPATGESRWIYRKTQRGFYSVRQEQFLTDKERGADGEFGPEWQPVEEREEENFYFRLMQDPATGLPGFDPKQWLLDFIAKRSADGNPFVVPDFRVAELSNAVAKLEGDLCISRPASRLKWGIPFPESFGAGFVTYVWFDALVNYITFVPGHDPNYEHRAEELRTPKPETSTSKQNAPDSEFGFGSSELRFQFADLWPPLHVIGKDILIPAHGVYWPVMLKALGFTDAEMPTLLVHGWWNIAGAKMSKSLGNIVDPDLLADKYGPEALRYYLMSDIATGKDADFSEERLIQQYNSALANSLGNLLNRSLNMAAKYREGKITKIIRSRPDYEWFAKQEVDPAVRQYLIGEEINAEASPSQLKFVEEFAPKTAAVFTFLPLWAKRTSEIVPYIMDGDQKEATDGYCVSEALAFIRKFVSTCNQAIELRKPWQLAKDPMSLGVLNTVLYELAESLRIIAILISPVLPFAAHGIFDQLNWKMDEGGPEAGSDTKNRRFRLSEATWGGLPDGHVLGKPVPLFPRIEAAPAEK